VRANESDQPTQARSREPIISANIRVRQPAFFQIGAYSIVDDFCYFSTKVRVGCCSHIANGCSVAGGADWQFELGNFSSLSAGVKVWCASDDFVNDLVALIPPGLPPVKEHLINGDVVVGDYTAVGSNSVIMPSNHIPEGTVVGALSFVPPAFDFLPWSVYAGTPVRYIRPRNREAVLAQAQKLTVALGLDVGRAR
jgi:acetyltransferase-like isoleucine patch superfamily enzyme